MNFAKWRYFPKEVVIFTLRTALFLSLNKMSVHHTKKKFYVIGISFEKADAETRGKFTFFQDSIEPFVNEAKESGVESFFVVSTCNRSEFYGFSENPQTMIDLYCKYTNGTVDEFLPVMNLTEGDGAIRHLFEVASGLKSQILGDFEIIGQIKTWFNRFKKFGSSDAFLERLVNTAIQISKKIKNQTTLSNGAASVSYAAVHYILSTQKEISEKNILLYGIGKIGRNTCTNLVKHTQNDHITLINRTKEKAEVLSQKYEVLVKDFSELNQELKNTDILVVATGADHHTITEEMIPFDKEMVIIDLSVPENVSHTLASRENIQLINVDGLSKMVDDTLGSRKESVPMAFEIIAEHKQEFDEWRENREFVPVIQSFKQRLENLHQFEFQNLQKKNPEINGNESLVADKLVQNLTNQFASYILENRENADHTIALMENIFRLKAKA